jgi:DNA-binding CsgD family transcriptional regulator/tetratricopeptide (TPR) repeat protein
MLHGRGREEARIGALLTAAAQGQGGALVVAGDPGAGKSALLAQSASVAEAEHGMTVLRTQGIESEAPLAFAALHRLLRPLRSRVGELAAPQAQALRVAFGEESGDTDRFLVFLAALGLLTEAAHDGPVLAMVDDAHWLDDASAAALLFVARRLEVEPVAMLFGAREGEARTFEAGDLPTMRLAGLDLTAVTELLSARTGTSVSAEVGAELLASTGGNPLALTELPQLLAPDQLTGRTALPHRLPVTDAVERAFLDRGRRLSGGAQRLLLVAAADDSTSVVVVTAAAASLGAGREALVEAEASGLVRVEGQGLVMRHPLVRSAVYAAASRVERQAAHAALAQVLTSPEDTDRRAWHLAASVDEPDQTIVAALDEAAARAEQRGGHEAASAAYQRAAELSGDPEATAQRLFAAGRTAWVSAHPDRALDLVDRAVRATEDPLLRADAWRLRGRIEWNTGSVSLAHRMLLEAAAAVAPHDPVRAREIGAEAVAISAWGGDSGVGIDALSVAPPPPGTASPRERCYAQMLLGLTHVVAAEWDLAVGSFGRAFTIHDEVPGDYELLPNLSIAAFHVGDYARSEAFLDRLLTDARSSGAVVMALYAVTRLPVVDLAAGRWADAAAHASEAVTLAQETGHGVLVDAPRAFLLLLAALRGEDAFDELAPRLDAATSSTATGILGVLLRDVVHWAYGVRQADRPASAFHQLAKMSHDVPKRLAGMDRIETALRADQPEAARLWIEDLAGFAEATGQPWAAAIAEHGRALLAAAGADPEDTDPGDAEAHFRRALELHEEGRRPFDRARTQLAYGEFLRRSRRRVDARTHLRSALETFVDLRAQPWADRASQELRASGETVRKRDEPGDAALTPQERQVAQLVTQGLSNKDVAAQLFLSPRTVDFHLRNVFAKTGVASRGELARTALA